MAKHTYVFVLLAFGLELLCSASVEESDLLLQAKQFASVDSTAQFWGEAKKWVDQRAEEARRHAEHAARQAAAAAAAAKKEVERKAKEAAEKARREAERRAKEAAEEARRAAEAAKEAADLAAKEAKYGTVTAFKEITDSYKKATAEVAKAGDQASKFAKTSLKTLEDASLAATKKLSDLGMEGVQGASALVGEALKSADTAVTALGEVTTTAATAVWKELEKIGALIAKFILGDVKTFILKVVRQIVPLLSQAVPIGNDKMNAAKSELESFATKAWDGLDSLSTSGIWWTDMLVKDFSTQVAQVAADTDLYLAMLGALGQGVVEYCQVWLNPLSNLQPPLPVAFFFFRTYSKIFNQFVDKIQLPACSQSYYVERLAKSVVNAFTGKSVQFNLLQSDTDNASSATSEDNSDDFVHQIDDTLGNLTHPTDGSISYISDGNLVHQHNGLTQLPPMGVPNLPSMADLQSDFYYIAVCASANLGIGMTVCSYYPFAVLSSGNAAVVNWRQDGFAVETGFSLDGEDPAISAGIKIGKIIGHDVKVLFGTSATGSVDLSAKNLDLSGGLTFDTTLTLLTLDVYVGFSMGVSTSELISHGKSIQRAQPRGQCVMPMKMMR